MEMRKNFPPLIERHDFNLSEFEYKCKGTNPGKILIFNHDKYDSGSSLTPRPGSRRDVNAIISCFQTLGFNIYKEDLWSNLTVDGIQEKIQSVLEDKETLEQANCLIIIFLTHGNQNDELHAFDNTFKCSEIWTKFNKCKELEGKPKMFIFQACKGDYYTTVDGEAKEGPAELVNIESFIVGELGVDMLILYSTIEGNESYRNKISGTWFIQELCRNFTAYGRRDDVISLATRTIKCVAGCYYNCDEDGIKKQMPIFVSTLSKKFYLNRNKDRHLLLEMVRKQRELYDIVMKMKK